MVGYFEELYPVYPRQREFPGVVSDPVARVNCDPLTLVVTRRAVNKLLSRKARGWCGIYAEMFKAEVSPPSYTHTFVRHLTAFTKCKKRKDLALTVVGVGTYGPPQFVIGESFWADAQILAEPY